MGTLPSNTDTLAPSVDNLQSLVQYDLSVPNILHTFPLVPKQIEKVAESSNLEISQYDNITRTAHFVIEGLHQEIDRVGLLLFQTPDDLRPVAKIEMHGTSADASNPFTRFSSVLKGVPPETPYLFELTYEDGRTVWAHDPFSLGLQPGGFIEIDKLKSKIPDGYPLNIREHNGTKYLEVIPKSILMDIRYLSDFDTQLSFKKDPLTPFVRRIWEIHTAYTKSIPDSELPPELRGTQGTYKGTQALIKEAIEKRIDCIQMMPLQCGLSEWEVIQAGLLNQWNYYNSSHYAPDPRRFHDKSFHGIVREIQETNRMWQRAGIKVILDVVLGHNSEGAEKGFASSLEYFSDAFHRDEHGKHADVTRCGNTINHDSIIVQDMNRLLEHFLFDICGFDGYRVDQWTVICRRSGSLKFDPDAPEAKAFASGARDRGKFINVEPSDCHNEFACHHGESDAQVAEQNLGSRQKMYSLFAGHCYGGFEHSDEDQVPIVRHAASLISRNHYHSKHNGILMRDKPLDVIMPDVHDGPTAWDQTREMYQDLVKAGMVNGYSELEIRASGIRAMHAFANMRPGMSLLRYNADKLASTLHASKNVKPNDPYTEESFLIKDRLDPADPRYVLKAQTESFMTSLGQLRDRLHILDYYSVPAGSELNIEWRDLEGKLRDVKTLEQRARAALRGLGSERELRALGRYFGVCYTGTEKGLQDTIREGYSQTAKPLFTAVAGCPIDFYLPAVPKGYFWRRILDTHLSSGHFTPVDCKPHSSNTENRLQAHYEMHLPGVALFELERV